MSSYHFVIIEDDRDDIELISEALSALHPAARILVIRDGKEALDFFRDMTHSRIDCMLMDYNMPCHNGAEVLEFVRATEHLAAIPIYMWTSAENADYREECMRKNATAFFVKPTSGDGYERIAAQMLKAASA